MTADTMGDTEQIDKQRESARRRQRRKNYALMALLFAWAVIIYLVAILRMGGAT
ncbi:MAG: hypothetical protein CFH10_00259 [Alphaproteobacteria bacterium MarineAlpha4_Bin2]|nr:MAG: hypothetical protein CFH10_00259 [Alphaproteobacteria bacterium MarineAlpha4_Bin2]